MRWNISTKKKEFLLDMKELVILIAITELLLIISVKANIT
jgi:hypothetical protein